MRDFLLRFCSLEIVGQTGGLSDGIVRSVDKYIERPSEICFSDGLSIKPEGFTGCNTFQIPTDAAPCGCGVRLLL